MGKEELRRRRATGNKYCVQDSSRGLPYRLRVHGAILFHVSFPVLNLLSMANVALARAYQQLFDSHPNVTLAITGGGLTALGDVVAQISQRVVRASPMFSGYFTRPPG